MVKAVLEERPKYNYTVVKRLQKTIVFGNRVMRLLAGS